MRFALVSTPRGPNEARDKTEMKPRESCILQWPHLHAFLIAFVCSLFVFYCLLSGRKNWDPTKVQLKILTEVTVIVL